MIKRFSDSTIEIWSCDYINNASKREPQDKNKEVIQCELGSGDNYIVEIVDRGEENG